jgi:predicted porin
MRATISFKHGQHRAFLRRQPYSGCTAIVLAGLLVALPTSGFADTATEEALKQQMARMQVQMLEMAASQKQLKEKFEKLKVVASRTKPSPPYVSRQSLPQLPNEVAELPVIPWHDTQTTVTGGNAFIVTPPGAGGGIFGKRIFDTDIALYGFVDVSDDVAYNGKQRVNEVASNGSFIGVRGGHDIGGTGLRAIFQVETLASVSATPGAANSIGSRNSFGGIETPFGTIMGGKNDTPYKRSTALMDPFAGSVGDYSTIMGNSAGEGRAEFDYRAPHAIWYDSPNFHGLNANVMYAPGQKLNNLTGSGASNYAFPQGELVCSGSQQPSLNGATPNTGPGGTVLCNDGAFNDLYSASVSYEYGPLYVTAAYELHKSVDRTSDFDGMVADETAEKIGATYHAPFGNQLSGIYEYLRREGVNPAYNERERGGFYLSDVQDLTHGFDLMAAWAHAGQTPGSPKFPGLSDRADMYDAGLKYHFDSRTSIYLVEAYLTQGAGAHYALGDGDHGAQILSPRTQTGGPSPGHSLNSTSVGFQYAF